MDNYAQRDWRFELVDDAGADSLQIAIRNLKDLLVAIESIADETSPYALASDLVSNSDPRHVVRWVLRVGFWIDPASANSISDRLNAWLIGRTNCRSETKVRLRGAIDRLEKCAELVPVEAPASRMELVWKLAEFQLLGKWHPPLQYADVVDFPSEFPVDPWSPFRKWQYYSDAVYLVHRIADYRKKLATLEISALTGLPVFRPESSRGKQELETISSLEEAARFVEAPGYKGSLADWITLNRGINRDPYSQMSYWPQEPWRNPPAIIGLIDDWLGLHCTELVDEASHSGERPRFWRGTEPYIAIPKGDIGALLHLLNVTYRSSSAPSWNLETHYRDNLVQAVLNVIKTLNDWNIQDGRQTYAIPTGLERATTGEIDDVVLFAQKLILALQEFEAGHRIKRGPTTDIAQPERPWSTFPILKEMTAKMKAGTFDLLEFARDRDVDPDGKRVVRNRPMEPQDIEGTPLYWLNGWGSSLEAWVDADNHPSECDWIRFRPDEKARDALDELSLNYQLIIRGILDYLDAANKRFDEFLNHANHKTRDAMAQAEGQLARRVSKAVEIINSNEKRKAVELSAPTSFVSDTTIPEIDNVNGNASKPKSKVAQAVKKPLSESVEQAYKMLLAAVEACGESTDRELYGWIREQFDDSIAIPEFGTWSRYVRAARKYHQTNKNSPRNGRKGRSIVKPDDICFESIGHDENG